MADRALLLSHLPGPGARGFEVGALMSPFLSRATHEVLLVDRLPTAQLRAAYAGDAGVDPARVAEVDVATGEASLAEALRPHRGDGFDFAIASHVIEHVPDAIGFLSDTAGLLRTGGRLLLVIPDKRYSFDCLRAVSTLADLVEAWIEGSRRPAPRHVFDFNARAVAVDAQAAWAGRLDPAALRPYSTPQAALALATAAHRDGAYHDAHCWVFTPRRFLAALAALVELGLLPWRVAFVADTRRDEVDFGVVLERAAAGAVPSALAAGLRAAALPLAPDPDADRDPPC